MLPSYGFGHGLSVPLISPASRNQMDLARKPNLFLFAKLDSLTGILQVHDLKSLFVYGTCALRVLQKEPPREWLTLVALVESPKKLQKIMQPSMLGPLADQVGVSGGGARALGAF